MDTKEGRGTTGEGWEFRRIYQRSPGPTRILAKGKGRTLTLLNDRKPDPAGMIAKGRSPAWPRSRRARTAGEGRSYRGVLRIGPGPSVRAVAGDAYRIGPGPGGQPGKVGEQTPRNERQRQPGPARSGYQTRARVLLRVAQDSVKEGKGRGKALSALDSSATMLVGPG